jgi:hypothetical protein
MEPGTTLQGQYLLDTACMNVATLRFDDDFGRTDQAVERKDGLALISAIATFTLELSSQSWPPSASLDVSRLEAHLQLVSASLRTWETARASVRPAAYARLNDVWNDKGKFANAVRADLGLPPVNSTR